LNRELCENDPILIRQKKSPVNNLNLLIITLMKVTLYKDNKNYFRKYSAVYYIELYNKSVLRLIKRYHITSLSDIIRRRTNKKYELSSIEYFLELFRSMLILNRAENCHIIIDDAITSIPVMGPD
jgi:hypothetical protein